MSTILKDCCDDLMNTVVNGKSKEELMEQCVREKLMQIYERENAEFDEMIDKLERFIDYNSVSQVKYCIKRIKKLLSSNRKQLYKVLRRVL